MTAEACCPIAAERLRRLDVACAVLARFAAGEPYPVADVPELAAAITEMAGVLGVTGLQDWGSPGFRVALDQAKAGAADDILAWCPCALT